MATWFVNSNAGGGTGTGLSWTNAFLTVFAGISSYAAGDTVFIGDNHAESTASNVSWAPAGTPANPTYFICADHTKSSPGSGDWKVSATITITGSNNTLSSSGNGLYVYGLNFTIGSGQTTNFSFNLATSGSTNLLQYYDACTFTNLTTNTNANIITITPSGGVDSARLIFNNTTLARNSTGGIGLHMSLGFGTVVYWRNTVAALGTTINTTVFSLPANGGMLVCDGVDLSAAGSGKTLVGASAANSLAQFNNCRLNSSVTIAATPTSVSNQGVYVCNSDSSRNYRLEAYKFEGTQTTNTNIVRTGGASDGTTAVSWQITANTNVNFINPYTSLTIDQWNTSTGSSRSAFLRGIGNTIVLPTNADVWIDIQYLGNSSYPLSSFVNSAMVNVLATATNITADTSAWDSQIAAWQPSHSYTFGNTMTLGNGQIYTCIGAGSSGSSQPAPVSDGSAITESGGVEWVAYVRFQMSVSLTPELVGSVFVVIKHAWESVTLWIDPLITAA